MFGIFLWIFFLVFSKFSCNDISTIIGNGQILFDLIGSEPNQTLTLLYRATVDGFGANKFHGKCDGHKQTITLIKTTNGFIFGGYANLDWKSSATDSYGNDPDAFLFSLKNPSNKPTLIKVSGTYAVNSLRYYSSYGPSFGANDLIITDLSDTNLASLSQLGISYRTNEPSTFFTGATNFQTTEIEVFESNLFINSSSRTLTTLNLNSESSTKMSTDISGTSHSTNIILNTIGSVTTTVQTQNSQIFNINNQAGMQQLLNVFQVSTYDMTGCLTNCSQNGLCNFDITTQIFSCKCQPNFKGLSCQIDQRPCSSYPCLNNSTCTNINMNNTLSFKCECQKEYYGYFCENKINLCDYKNCSSYGYCVEENLIAKCKCLINYFGDNCEYETSQIKLIKNVQTTSIALCFTIICLFCLVILLNDASNIFIFKKSPKKNKKRFLK